MTSRDPAGSDEILMRCNERDTWMIYDDINISNQHSTYHYIIAPDSFRKYDSMTHMQVCDSKYVMFPSTWWITYFGGGFNLQHGSGGSIWCSTSRTFVGKTCCGTWSPIRPSKRASLTSSGVPGNSACCCLLPPWRFGFKDLQPFMFRCVQRFFNNEEIPKTGKVVLLTHLFRSHDLKTFRDHFSDLHHNYMCTSLPLLYSNILELDGKSQVPSFHCKISHNPSTDMSYGFLYGGLSFSRFNFHWVCMGLP